MVNSTGSATGTANSSTAATVAMKKSTGLNKDDFLKLFVEQLKNQDPLNPQDSSEFVAQLAQLTQVEQSYNTNINLQNMIEAFKGTSALNASSMIGRNVTATGNQLNFDGVSSQLRYTLPASATSTTITISDGAGKTVRTINLGANASGNNAIAWDGKDDAGAVLPPGIYSFAVSAKASDGSAITGTTYTTGKIDGIAFEGANPILKIGNIQIPLSAVAGIS